MSWRFCAIILVLACSVLTMSGCAPADPPPNEVLAVLAHVREGYGADDAALFCTDFADVMFTGGFTLDTYRQTIQQVKAQLGDWKSEVYLGEKDSAYTWRVTFAKAKAKLLLVMDPDWRVTGLWFR
jgi:hypothetical protein